MKIKKFSMPNKLSLRLAAGVVAVSLAIALIPNANLANNDYTSLKGIELLKNEIGRTNPYNVLEIVPEENTGSIGYYVEGQEPSTTLILDELRSITANAGSLETAQDLRKKFIDKVILKLEEETILGKKDATARPLVEKKEYVYTEYKPWEEIPGDFNPIQVNLESVESGAYKGTITKDLNNGSFDKVKAFEYVGKDAALTDAYQKVDALKAVDKADVDPTVPEDTSKNPNKTPSKLYYSVYFEEVESNGGREFDETEYLNKAFYTLKDIQPPLLDETITFDTVKYQYVGTDGEVHYAIKHSDGAFYPKGTTAFEEANKVATEVVTKNSEDKYIYTSGVKVGTEVLKHTDGKFYAFDTTDFDAATPLEVVEELDSDTFEYFGVYGDERTPVNYLHTYYVPTIYAGPFETIAEAKSAIIPSTSDRLSPATPFIGIGTDITDLNELTLDQNEDGKIDLDEAITHEYQTEEVLDTSGTKDPLKGYMPGVKKAFMENSKTYLYVGEKNGEYVFNPDNSSADEYILNYQSIYFELPYENNHWMLNHALDYDVSDLDEAVEKFPIVVNSKLPTEITEEDINSAEMIVVSSAFRLIDTGADPDTLVNYGTPIPVTTEDAEGNEVVENVINDLADGLVEKIEDRVNDYDVPLVIDGSLESLKLGTTNVGELYSIFDNTGAQSATGFVNGSVYIYPSTTQLAQEGFYTSDFPEADYLTDTAPYFQVYSQILTENTLRDTLGEDEDDRIPVDVNVATSLRSIMSFAERLVENKKTHIRVLEIQPKVVMSYDKDSDTITKKSGELTQEYVSEELLNDEIIPENIEIVTMSTAEFNSSIDNVVENFDMVYVGGSTNGYNVQKGENGEPVTNFNDNSMDGMLYTNIGDSYLMDHGTGGSVYPLGGWLNSDYISNAILAYREDSLPADSDVIHARFAGTDITDLKKEQLQEFAESGYPLIISDELIVPEALREENLKLEITGTPLDNQHHDYLPAGADNNDVVYELQAKVTQDSIDVTRLVKSIQWFYGANPLDPAEHLSSGADTANAFSAQLSVDGTTPTKCVVTLETGTTLEAEFITEKDDDDDLGWEEVSAEYSISSDEAEVEVTIKGTRDPWYAKTSKQVQLEVVNPTQEEVDPHKISFQWYRADLAENPNDDDSYEKIPSQVNRIYKTQDTGYFKCEVSIVDRFTEEETDFVESGVIEVTLKDLDVKTSISGTGAYVHPFEENQFIARNSSVYPKISYDSGPKFYPITTDLNNEGDSAEKGSGWNYTSTPVFNFETNGADPDVTWLVYSTYGKLRPTFEIGTSGPIFPDQGKVDYTKANTTDAVVDVDWNKFPVYEQAGSGYKYWNIYVPSSSRTTRNLEDLINANNFTINDEDVLTGTAIFKNQYGYGIGTDANHNMNNNSYFGTVASITVGGETFYSFADYISTGLSYTGIKRGGMNYFDVDASVELVSGDTLYDIKGLLEDKTTTFWPMVISATNVQAEDKTFTFTAEATAPDFVKDTGLTPIFTYEWYKYNLDGSVTELPEKSHILAGITSMAIGEEYICVISDGHDYVYDIKHFTVQADEDRLIKNISTGDEIEIPSKVNTEYGQIDETRVDNSSKTFEYLDNLVTLQTEEDEYKNVFSETRATTNNTGEVLKYLNLSKPMIEFTTVTVDGEEKELKPTEYVDEYFGDIYSFKAIETEADGGDVKPGGSGGSSSSGTVGELAAEFNSRDLYYEFTIENPTDTNPANTRYEVNLYVDLNSDGRYSGEEEKIEDLIIKEHEERATDDKERGDGAVVNNGELSSEVVYTVSRTLPNNFRYAIPWKLEVVEVVDDTPTSGETIYAPHNSQVGITYRARESGEPMPIIKVLQIRAPYGSSAIARMDSYDNGKYRYDGHDYIDGQSGNLIATQGIPEYEAAFNQLYANDIYDIQLTDITTNVMVQKAEAGELDEYFNGFDMIVLGFADGNGNFDSSVEYEIDGVTYQGISPAATKSISDYIASGRTTLFTPGVIKASALPTDYYPMSNGGNTGAAGGKSVQNWMLRDIAGLDNYGITNKEFGFATPVEEFYNDKLADMGEMFKVDSSNLVADSYSGASNSEIQQIIDAGNSIAYKPDSNKEEFVKETQGFSNAMYSAYAKGSVGENNLGFANGVLTEYGTPSTTQISQVNKGQITTFPYNVNVSSLENRNDSLGDDDFLTIRGALPQPYQLNMNSDEIAVWYTLSSNAASSFFNNSYNDAVNNYFIYNMGNVTYIGVGGGLYAYTEDPDVYEIRAAEAKLFTNTIISSYRSSAATTGIKMVDPATKLEITTHFIPRPLEDVSTDKSLLSGFKSKLSFQLNDDNLVESMFTDLHLYYEDNSNGDYYRIESSDYNLVYKNDQGEYQRYDEGTMIEIPAAGTVFKVKDGQSEPLTDEKVESSSFDTGKTKYSLYDYFATGNIKPELTERLEVAEVEDGETAPIPSIAEGEKVPSADKLESNAVYTIELPEVFINKFDSTTQMTTELEMYLSVKTLTGREGEKVEVVSYSNVMKLRQLGLIELN